MSTLPPSEDSLHWKRDESIDLPQPESEGRLAIRRQDWKRLKARIQRTDDSWGLSVVYSTLFGFAGSAGLSIIPIAATKDLPAWVAPLYVCLFLFSLLSAFVFLAVDKKLKTRRHSERQDVIEEMVEIEGMFIRRKGLQNPVDVSTTEPIKNPATANSETGDQE
jgi:hypothetical protein